ncbi:MAG TPA: hypothetical protein VN419_07730 [Humidesulfovibrio sp.]|uniref:hypothetical protein n=1 Tax=Humidesulfovibrio sp. TaxID=2910988 RepID=UPI002B9812FF|nr:hypothetical protein [Humidesulfovibrio sp.]HWR03896.1 hypothetical protein [Humidesulfovibrio sp.]
MQHDLLSLLTPLAALAVAALAQAISYRLRPSMPVSYLAALFAGLACLGALFWALPGPDATENLALALANVGAFLGLWLCFAAGVVGLGISLRIRIIAYLRHSGRPRTEAEIETAFKGGLLVAQRLERLLAGGHIRKENCRLYSNGTWLTRVARFNTQVKRFLTGHASEFGA